MFSGYLTRRAPDRIKGHKSTRWTYFKYNVLLRYVTQIGQELIKLYIIRDALAQQGQARLKRIRYVAYNRQRYQA
jgi:hypothetical protein